MKNKNVKGGVAKALFKNYFIGYVILILIMIFMALVTITIYFSYLFYPSSLVYEDINENIVNNYKNISEERLKEINGFIITVNDDSLIDYRCGNVIKEFESISLNDYMRLFNSEVQFKEKGHIKNYFMKTLESMFSIIDLDNIVIKSEDGIEYSISYKYLSDSDKLIIFGMPYDNINKYGNYNATKGSTNHIVLLILINIICLLVIIFVFAKVTAKKFVKPIKTLEAGMNEITEGNYGEQIKIKDKNEFNELAEGFNLMSTTIKNEKEENLRLQQERNKLILHISHDLKNPLSAVLGYSDLLINQDLLSDEEKKEYLKIISKNSERSNKIITDLFEFSLLDSANYTLNLKLLDVNEVLREILAYYIPELEAKEIKYEFNLLEDEYLLNIDEVKFTRAISNLIDNAIKYNKANTILTVACEKTANGIEIIISDNGKGIEKNVRGRIFDAFVREDKARNSKTGGTGLGLAITKAIIEKHGGIIILDDSEFGTRFKITLYK